MNLNNIRVFPIETSPGFIIHILDTMLAAGLGRAFRQAGYELTAEQWGVLSKLWEVEGLHQSELAARLGKDRHNMSRVLGLMERNGLIEKRHDPDDKRRLLVFLTPIGKERRQALTGIVNGFLEQCFQGLGQEDVEAMTRIHERIIQNLADDHGCPGGNKS